MTLAWPEDSEEEDDFDEEANAARSLEFTQLIPNEDQPSQLKNALRNSYISGSMTLDSIHLTQEFLDFFTSAAAK